MNEASALAVNCHTSLCVLSHPKGERKKERSTIPPLLPTLGIGLITVSRWLGMYQISQTSFINPDRPISRHVQMCNTYVAKSRFVTEFEYLERL